MAARTTNADIVGLNNFAFANNLGHYRGRLTAKLAKHLVTRMAAKRLDYPIEPMTLQNMRENGVRSLDVSCWNCHHRAILSADSYPDHVPVPTFGRRMAWLGCGIIGVDALPNWRKKSTRPGTNHASPLRGAKLYRMMPMAERPRATHKTFAALTAVRVIAGVAVFALGVVAGAGFAAWLMPPF